MNSINDQNVYITPWCLPNSPVQNSASELVRMVRIMEVTQVNEVNFWPVLVGFS